MDVDLKQFEKVTTLGIGAFGRVDLVKLERNNEIKTYALKRMQKKHILATQQKEHVLSERLILLTCNHPFICRLFQTYRDSKYVYMLLEACLGGEVWTILRKKTKLSEYAVQFIFGCVLEAIEYLHIRGIIYRDLKPENLMLGNNGYVKMVIDFCSFEFVSLL